ncbi:MAG: ATP-binding protein, partial [Flavobacteriales bacterium]|nr:ATP-binding protein [Flavobacteriales bacterium]
SKFQRENAGVYMIRLSPPMTIKGMYNSILNSIRKEDLSRNDSISNLKHQLRLELESRDGNNLIIIDDASRFEKEKVSYLYELRNITMHHSGLIISISTHEDYDKLIFKWLSKDVKGIKEFYLSFSYFVKLQRPTIEEIRTLFKANDLFKSSEGRELFKVITNSNLELMNWGLIRYIIKARLNI